MKKLTLLLLSLPAAAFAQTGTYPRTKPQPAPEKIQPAQEWLAPYQSMPEQEEWFQGQTDLRTLRAQEERQKEMERRQREAEEAKREEQRRKEEAEERRLKEEREKREEEQNRWREELRRREQERQDELRRRTQHH